MEEPEDDMARKSQPREGSKRTRPAGKRDLVRRPKASAYAKRTADNTIIRKAAVTSGDAVGSDAFNPSLQWDGYAIDSFGGLGAHTSSCPHTATSATTRTSARPGFMGAR